MKYNSLTVNNMILSNYTPKHTATHLSGKI